MRCEDYLEQLSAYLDQNLSAEEETELMSHLEHCETCKETLETLKEIQGYLKTLEDKELPKGFHQELMSKVVNEKSIKTAHKPRFFAIASSIAAVLICIVALKGPLAQMNHYFSAKDMTRGMPESASLEAQPYTAETRESAGYADVVPKSRSVTSKADNQESQDIVSSSAPISLEELGLDEAEAFVTDEWKIQTTDLKQLIQTVEEWAEVNQIQPMTTIQGNEASIYFSEPIDRVSLQEVLTSLSSTLDLQVLSSENDELSLIITQSTP